jgi:hypothetical protein
MHCGGETLKPLDGETTYPFRGSTKTCKEKCLENSECDAFVRRISDKMCFWKSGVTADTMVTKEGLVCYSLNNDSNMDVNVEDLVLGEDSHADCMDAGYESASREQCKGYGKVNDLRFKEVKKSNRPTGCYVEAGTDLVFWNTASGRGKEGAQPVCVRGNSGEAAIVTRATHLVIRERKASLHVPRIA